MQANCKALLAALLWLACTGAAGADLVEAGRVAKYFRQGIRSPAVRLATLTAEDLRYAGRARNVERLLDLAVDEGRLDAIEALQFSRKGLVATEDDAALLLACLQKPACEPEAFIRIGRMSELHAAVALENPALGTITAHHAVGDVSEALMLRYFERGGWASVPGQIGRNGIDGLFVKLDRGVVKDVLVVESKYNSSALQLSSAGQQMSDSWIRTKVDELVRKFPDDAVYADIKRFVEAGSYRSVLWNVKQENGALRIRLDKLAGKGTQVKVLRTPDVELDALGTPLERPISLSAPRTDLEKDIVRWYGEAVRQSAERAPARPQ